MATDHKPLISLLRTKSLDQVPNVRLFRIKQRISMWKFDIIHCPGKTNFFADATSRNPIAADSDDMETAFMAANLAAIAITMEDVASAAKSDDSYRATYLALTAGEAPSPAECKEYHQYRDRLYPREDVLMYDDRLVIPESIRERVLDVLHATHQGRSSMLHRASQSVFWPGYTADIEKRRAGCQICNTITPSQQQVPVEQSEPPTTPFESIAANFFDLAGVHYLVTVDGLSGWLDVTRAAPGTAGSGAKGLKACLRLLFADKGVPEILSSDDGMEFTAAETKEFLRTWQVKHRLSFTHFP